MSSRNMGEFRFVRPESAVMAEWRKGGAVPYSVQTREGVELGLVFNRYHPAPILGRPYRKIQRWYAYGVAGEFGSRREAAEALATAKGKTHGGDQA